jgi:hypothetical protein
MAHHNTSLGDCDVEGNGSGHVGCVGGSNIITATPTAAGAGAAATTTTISTSSTSDYAHLPGYSNLRMLFENK